MLLGRLMGPGGEVGVVLHGTGRGPPHDRTRIRLSHRVSLPNGPRSATCAQYRSRGSRVSQAKGGGLDVGYGERESWHSVAFGGSGLGYHTTRGPNQRLIRQ